MAVTDDERAVGGLRDDQMHAVLPRGLEIAIKQRLERRRGGQLRITEIAPKAEIGHHRRLERHRSRRADTQHVQLAARHVVGRDPLGKQRGEIIARTHDRRLGADRTARRLDHRRRDIQRLRLAAERDAVFCGQVGRNLRNGRARFNTQFVRAVECRTHRIRPDRRHLPRRFRCGQPLTALAHLGREERIDDRFRFRITRRQKHPALENLDPGLGRNLGPNLARLARHVPAVTRPLTGYRDETEVADRGPVCLRVPIDNHDFLAPARRRERVRETDDTGADDGQVIHGEPAAGGRKGAIARE